MPFDSSIMTLEMRLKLISSLSLSEDREERAGTASVKLESCFPRQQPVSLPVA